MATVTGYALRLPTSIMNEVKEAAEAEATSINTFITVAVARRLAELKTARYFEARAAGANPEDFKRIIAKAGTLPPQEGDEIPEGWLDVPENEDKRASATRR
ncbi:hypothetical protein GCM10011611_52870 [Aliidongia dinghuensis]|uniref:Toxin-antitoxin system HicB family antitoxin n=1 Tax=Aliidongia dinghuensis TaxID=1867774 RepID=A0A8J2Z0J0_9PROT|nr:toxin-antitoxin system HicB family antitoxin [Aliidongia dinghuensis]GGF39894.1 hypothetical protein GCM10011611_52870 [Aliidongia dinghuensis]